MVAFVSTKIIPVQNPFATDQIFQASLSLTQQGGWLHQLIEPWLRWDTGWYVKIAGQGYTAGDGTIAFLPAYPSLVRVTGWLTGDLLLGSLIVSSVACLIALILLYRLVLYETRNPRFAHHAVLALVSFPTSYYLMAGYTESTFLAFVLGTFLALRYKQWRLVTLLAACSALTRFEGVFVCLPIVWIAFLQREKTEQIRETSLTDRLKVALPKMLAVVAAPLAAILYVSYVELSGFGSIAEAYARRFGWEARPPWITVEELINKVLTGHANLIDAGQIIALLLMVILGIRAIRLLPLIYHLFLWPTLGFIMIACDHLYPLNSMTRYTLHFFPVFMVIGILLVKHPRWRPVWIIGGFLVQMIMLYLFIHWAWIA